jgi:hypothetical protein
MVQQPNKMATSLINSARSDPAPNAVMEEAEVTQWEEVEGAIRSEAVAFQWVVVVVVEVAIQSLTRNIVLEEVALAAAGVDSVVVGADIIRLVEAM